MSGPSFDNIDRWLFEYVEGNLTQEQEEQLELFIQEHPEFELDLDSWQGAKLESVQYVFPNQEDLFREEKEDKRRILPYAMFTGVISVIILILLNTYTYNTAQSEIKFQAKNTSSLKTIQNSKKNANLELINSKIENLVPYRKNQLEPIKENNQDLSFSNVVGNEEVTQLSNSKISSEKFNLTKKNSISNSNSNNLNSSLLSEKTVVIDSALSKVEDNENNMGLSTNENNQVQNQKNKKERSSKSISLFGKIKKLSSKLDDYMGNSIGLKNTRDHQFHVPGITQLDANFSSAGDVSSTKFKVFSRAQWISNNNQSYNNQMSLDWYSKTIKSGFAIQGNYQYYGNGVIQNWNTALIYSPKILLSKSFLIEPAIRFKMGNKILAANKVNGINQVEINRENALDFYADGSTPIGKSLWYRDIGTSLLLHSKWFYAGFQMDNLLKHQDNIYSNNISNPRLIGYHYTINLGTEYESKSGNISLAPYFYYQKFENLEESWGGINFQYKWLALGSAVSNKSNFALSIGLRLSTFALTYQFDQTYSAMLDSKANSHQIGLTINSKPSRSPRKYIRIK